MNYFTFDIRKIILAILAIVIPLLAINMQRNSEEELWFTRPFTYGGGLVQKAYYSFSSGVRSTTSLYLDLIDIKTQNRVLLKENQELRAQLGTLTELKLENQRLSDLLGFKQKTKMELLATRVIGNDAIPDHETISINKGSNEGIKKNMAALTVGGVVGYVFRVEPMVSQILVMTDRYSVIDAIVQRSRARGIVEGKSRDRARLRYLRRQDDVQEGDLIVTSGLHNIFPKGFPIGTVKSVKHTDYGLSHEVELAPAVNAANLEEIFVVLNAYNEDLTPKEPAPTTEENPIGPVEPPKEAPKTPTAAQEKPQ